MGDQSSVETAKRPPLWHHDALPRCTGGTGALRAFIARHTVELGPGQYALVGDAARLRVRLDQRLAEVAQSVGAEAWHVPSSDHVFRALRGTQLASGRTITALSTSHGDDNVGFEPLLRQSEFSIREVVVIGSTGYVHGQRARLLAATQQLVRDLDLAADLEVATDPLLVSEDPSARAYQALHATRLELVLALDASTRIAASSFHLHGTHVAGTMAITACDTATVETACVRWEIERWMAAVVARWGDRAP